MPNLKTHSLSLEKKPRSSFKNQWVYLRMLRQLFTEEANYRSTARQPLKRSRWDRWVAFCIKTSRNALGRRPSISTVEGMRKREQEACCRGRDLERAHGMNRARLESREGSRGRSEGRSKWCHQQEEGDRHWRSSAWRGES